ncbi:MAG: hypothetical protein RPR97_01010 [Colwellia sp.]
MNIKKLAITLLLSSLISCGGSGSSDSNIGGSRIQANCYVSRSLMRLLSRELRRGHVSCVKYRKRNKIQQRVFNLQSIGWF